MNRRFKWDKQYLYWGITAVCVIACSITFFTILSRWPDVRTVIEKLFSVLSPIIYGLMFAYLLNKIMTFIENKLMSRLFRKMRAEKPAKALRVVRIISVTVTMVFALLLICGALTLILPQIYNSVKNLISVLPGYIDTVINWLAKTFNDNPELESAAVNLVGNITEQFTSWIQTTFISQADRIIANLVGGVIGVVRVTANLAIGLVISVYVIYRKEYFAAQSKKFIFGFFKVRYANAIIKGVQFFDKTCGSFITSKLIDSLIVGIVCYIVMIILKMPYAMLISVIVGVTNIIPFFGPFIGGIPSAILILLVSPTKGLIFIIFIAILQQLDGNVLYPKIQGNSLGLSGFWIIFSLLFFGGLAGFWGMLLGVPVFAVIYAALKSINNVRLEKRGLPVNTLEYKKIYVIDEDTGAPVYKKGHSAPDGEAVSDGETDDDEQNSGGN